MENKTIKSGWFYGNKVSEYGRKNGYVDYRTLAESFDGVLNNDIVKLFFTEIGNEYNEPTIYCGNDYNEETDQYTEIFQYYIISSAGAEILAQWTNEIVYYLPALDMYVWGVTHFGTAWDYVLTDIKIEEE